MKSSEHDDKAKPAIERLAATMHPAVDKATVDWLTERSQAQSARKKKLVADTRHLRPRGE